MPFIEITPDLLEYEQGNKTVTGAGGVLLTALNDASDASYVTPAGVLDQGWLARFRMGSLSGIPAGASIEGVQFKFRYSHYSHSPAGNAELIFPQVALVGKLTGGVHNYSLFTVPEDPFNYTTDTTTPTDLLGAFQKTHHDGTAFIGAQIADDPARRLYVQVLVNRQVALNQARLYRLALLVHYVRQPTIVITSPTGTVPIGRPQIVWTYTQPDAETQRFYDLRIFKKSVADTAGFDGLDNDLNPLWMPDYRAAVTSGANVHQIASSFADNGVQYSAYIRARTRMIWDQESYGRHPDMAPNTLWDRQDFTFSFVAPQQPTIMATANNPDHSVAVEVEGIDNMLDFNSSTLEDTTTTGWTALASTSIANTSSQFLDGARSLQMTRNSTTGDAGASTTAVAVIPGEMYSAQAWFRANTTSRTGRVFIVFRDAGGGFTGFDTSNHAVADVNTGWRQSHAWGVAPANTITAEVWTSALSAVATEVHFVDRVGLFHGLRNNLLTDNQASIEVDATGWVAGTNTTLARVVQGDPAYDRSAVLELTRTTSTGDAVATTPTGTSGFVATVGVTYTASARFKAPSVARTVRVAIIWYTAAGAVVSTSAGSTPTDTTTGWTTSTITATAPATTAFAAVEVRANSMLTSEKHFVDGIGCWPMNTEGLVPSWNVGGFLHDDPMDHVMMLQRSMDAGVTWETLPEQRVDHMPRHQTLTYTDFEVPSGGTVSYRAMIQTPNVDGDIMNSPWSKTVSATLPLLTSYKIRDPLDSTGELNMAIRVVSFSKTWPKPNSVGYPLESNAAVMTHLGLRDPSVRMEVDLLDEDTYAMFFDLMHSGNVLLIMDVIGNLYYVQPTAITGDRLLAVKMPAETWPVRHAHRVSVDMISVDRDTAFILPGSGTSGMTHG